MDTETLDRMEKIASQVARRAYVPASGFRVGAAVCDADGRIFSGCNVENASFGLTICAERNAMFHAVAEGATQLAGVVVWTPLEEPGTPCGACRQVLFEFAIHDGDIPVVLVGSGAVRRELRLRDLLPKPFRFGGNDS